MKHEFTSLAIIKIKIKINSLKLLVIVINNHYLLPLLLFQVKVIDEEGVIVPVNTPGELCFRGHCVFQGYWDDEAKTKEAIDQNGWFHSG